MIRESAIWPIQNQGDSWTRNFLGQKKVLAVNRHGYETSVLISQTGEVIHRVPVCATSSFFCTQYTYRDINLGVPVGSNPVFIQNGVIEVTNNSATCKSTSSSQGLYAKPIATSLTSGPTSWNVVFEGVVATSETPITSGSNCGDGWNGL